MATGVVIEDEDRERFVLADAYWYARLRLSGQSQSQFVADHRDAIDGDRLRPRRARIPALVLP